MLHVVAVDMVVVHIESASGSLGMILAVGPGLPRSEFTGLMGLNLGMGVYIGARIAVEVEVAALPVGVGLGSSLQ